MSSATSRTGTRRIPTRIVPPRAAYSIPTGIDLPYQVTIARSDGENNMKVWGRANLAVAGLAGVWLSGLRFAAQRQANAPAREKTGEAVKKVTTNTLQELSGD